VKAHGWFHGLRFGTNLPGVVTAGKTIALEIDHEFYKRVIVEVEDSPEAAAAQIDAARKRGRPGGA